MIVNYLRKSIVPIHKLTFVHNIIKQLVLHGSTGVLTFKEYFCFLCEQILIYNKSHNKNSCFGSKRQAYNTEFYDLFKNFYFSNNIDNFYNIDKFIY